MTGWPAALLWAVAGLGAGVLARWGSVRLARLEGLEPGFERWQVQGPPVLAILLFGILGYRLGFTPALFIRSLWAGVLVQVIFFDLEHRLILNRVLLPAALAAIALSFVTPGLGWKLSLVAGAGAGLAFAILALTGALVFRTEAMGMGDVKLAAFIGLILGLYPDVATARALILGVVLAGIAAVALLVTRVRRAREGFAYGPFLAAGTLIVLLQFGAK
ncbi:MAG: prepilin peptidase [Candidatus Dormibacteraceae bacterium]